MGVRVFSATVLIAALACQDGSRSACVDAECTSSTGLGIGSSGSGDRGVESEGSEDSGDDDPAMDSHGPRIIDLATNLSSITEGDVLTVTAIVTDPDGVDDLIGGNLTNADGSVTFGSFATNSEEGSYQIDLPWSVIHQNEPIEFEAPEMRMFRARFFDQSGHETSSDFSLELTCDELAACDGRCVDLVSGVENCGACDKTCTSEDCNQGVCRPAWGECIRVDDRVFANCGEYCASRGLECLPACTGTDLAGTTTENNTVEYFDEFLAGCGHEFYYAQGYVDPCTMAFRWGESTAEVDTFVSAMCCCGG